MKYLDYLCAWTILGAAVVFILKTEIWHLRGAILDIPFFWIVVVIMNFLRLKNSYASVRGLRLSCVGTNLIVLVLELGPISIDRSDSSFWGDNIFYCAER
jgi:hypothetical protein